MAVMRKSRISSWTSINLMGQDSAVHFKNPLGDSFGESHPSRTCCPKLRSTVLGSGLHPINIYSIVWSILSSCFPSSTGSVVHYSLL